MENTIISKDLMDLTETLIRGARITKIDNDLQLENIVAMGRQIKTVRLEIEKQGEAGVKPLYKVYKDAQSLVSEKVDALKALEKNISNVTGQYQFEKQEAARKEQERLIEEARQKQIALANEQNKRIEEEEALRAEAAEKMSDAESILAEMESLLAQINDRRKSYATEAERLIAERETASLKKTFNTLQAKRNALIAESNTANEVADIAIKEAAVIETQIQEVVPDVVVPIYNPKGLSTKRKLVATVTDYRAVIKWIVDNKEYGLIEGAAFKSLIEAAAKKYAGNIADKSSFKMDGAVCKEETLGWF